MPQNLFQPVADACSQHGCKKAVIDARNLQVDFDTLALFRAGEDAPLLTFIGLRTALLTGDDQRDRFFDNVAFNRGSAMGIFTDESEALALLQK